MKKTIKSEAKVIEAFLCDYSDAYILVTGYIRAAADDANTKVTFKNCTPFTKRINHINDEHVGNAKKLWYYNTYVQLDWIQCNHSDTSGSLWQFKRDESTVTNDGNPDNVSTDNSTSFKYKTSFISESTAINNNT